MEAQGSSKPKVSLLTLVLSHYRIPVHEQIRENLERNGVEYDLVYSDPVGVDAEKRDTATLSWAKKINLTNLSIFGHRLPLQWAFRAISNSDLVIVSQENKLLMNYYLIARSLLTGKKMAYFGHGRGYQSRNSRGILEKWKRFLARRANWWFAYTPGVVDYLVSIGYPEDRITTVNNSIDTTDLRMKIEAVSETDIRILKMKLGIHGENVGLYLGGMYPEKRIPFLCESAVEIRKHVPDFELLLGGSGSDYRIAREFSEKYEFIHAPGPLFEKDRATALKLSNVFLMPGLVGLAVIDSFVGECPIVTTDYPFHSPEFEYLQGGENGVVVPDDGSVKTYSRAVTKLLKNPAEIARLNDGCRKSGKLYTAENMARNFSDGIVRALSEMPGTENRTSAELSQLAGKP